jgi:hypothetical protein
VWKRVQCGGKKLPQLRQSESVWEKSGFNSYIDCYTNYYNNWYICSKIRNNIRYESNNGNIGTAWVIGINFQRVSPAVSKISRRNFDTPRLASGRFIKKFLDGDFLYVGGDINTVKEFL